MDLQGFIEISPPNSGARQKFKQIDRDSAVADSQYCKLLRGTSFTCRYINFSKNPTSA